ncbi:hypothetical protein POCGH01_14068000 [Plasmodium ovale]|uniref:Uncharacterized protein n=2 Tax=Plasmodium ovale TaxID=36330 RepID=A0A1A8WA63_PLAOA|nr:hypothetical protein POVCU2_0050930 [Plasmodium ovale curtisi]SBT00452.1 hypothetical protein POVCU1_060080 [Plasmodium ovale curtisi]SCQ17235.1 hypothetical protein POCGH01_14068000 [Plasmodium ovale]
MSKSILNSDTSPHDAYIPHHSRNAKRESNSCMKEELVQCKKDHVNFQKEINIFLNSIRKKQNPCIMNEIKFSEKREKGNLSYSYNFNINVYKKKLNNYKKGYRKHMKGRNKTIYNQNNKRSLTNISPITNISYLNIHDKSSKYEILFAF